MRRNSWLVYVFLGIFVLCSSIAFGAKKSQTDTKLDTAKSAKQQAGKEVVGKGKKNARAPKTFHVKADDNGTTIQSQIDLAQDGDTVEVADGTYSGTGNINLDFGGKAIIVKSLNGPANCFIDVQGGVTRPSSSKVVAKASSKAPAKDVSKVAVKAASKAPVKATAKSSIKEGEPLTPLRGVHFHSGETSAAVFDGFTIKGGSAEFGGAILIENSSAPTIKNCILEENSATGSGGGVYINASNPTFINCTFAANSTDGGGGAIAMIGSLPVITNCTFSANYAMNGGGILAVGSSPEAAVSTVVASAPVITNTILWDNTPNEIHADAESTPVVTYSDVAGGFSGEGNVDKDPLFYEPESKDFHLKKGSPCIDKGNNEAVEKVDLDQDGNPRIVNEIVDMGALEYQLKADFVGDPVSGNAPLTVQFTDKSSGSIMGWNWDFGDGSGTSDEQNPSYTFEAAGEYTVMLVVVDENGNDDNETKVKYITVTEPAPVAKFWVDKTKGPKGMTVTFNNTSTNATSFQWNFKDGGTSTSKEKQVQHTFNKDGSWSVTLKAVGPGGEDTYTMPNPIVVYPLPVAKFTAAPTEGFAPLQVKFTNTSTGAETYSWRFGDGDTSTSKSPTHTFDKSGEYEVVLTAKGPGGTDTAKTTITVFVPVKADFRPAQKEGVAPLQVNFINESTGATSYVWDFGDGKSSTAESPSHKYTTPGTFTVKLTAKGNGKSDTATGTVKVYAPVVADFSAAPTTGDAPLTVRFTNKSTGATVYAWDFGDGESSAKLSPSHEFTEPGTYTVELKATGKGGEDTKTLEITVKKALAPPVANFTANKTTVKVNTAVSFTDTSTGKDITDWLWTFGDGKTSTLQNPTKKYTQPGTYTVTLTVTNDAGSNKKTRTNYIKVTR